MKVTLTTHNMSVLDMDFVPMDFDQPVPDHEAIEEDRFDFKLDVKRIGSGVVPENPDDWGRWDEVAFYEGQLYEEIQKDFKPYVTQFEVDCFENAIDPDDMPKGPDPYRDDPVKRTTYDDAIIEALKVRDLLYAV